MKSHLRRQHGTGAVCGRRDVLVETDPLLVSCRDCLRKATLSPAPVPLPLLRACAERVSAATLDLIATEACKARVPEHRPGSQSYAQACLRAVIAELQRHVIPGDVATWQTEHAPKTAWGIAGKALRLCENHSDIVLLTSERDSTYAYRIGNAKLKAGELGETFDSPRKTTDAVKAAIDEHALEDCPLCDKMLAD